MQRHIKRKRIINNLTKSFFVNIIPEECQSNVVRDLLKAFVFDPVKVRWRHYRDTFRHIESAVRSKAFYNGFSEINVWGLSIGTVIVHLFKIIGY